MNFYGYKNHLKVDKNMRLISDYMVTDASVHDFQVLDTLLEDADAGQPLYADAAYIGQEACIEACGMTNQVHEKGSRSRKLTKTQKVSNLEKSRSRARVEHVFGFVTNSMHGLYIRTIGYVRATGKIGLINLTYNLIRCVRSITFSWDKCAQ